MLETPVQQQPNTGLNGPSLHVDHGPGFVFIPITGAEASKGRGAAKPIIRAHVTRVQHARSSALNSTQNSQTWSVKPYVYREQNIASRKKATPRPKANEGKKLQPRKGSSSEASADTTSTTTTPETAMILHIPKLPTSAGALADPFNSSPTDNQPSLSPLLAHYVQHIAVDVPDIDGPNTKGLLRRKFLPMMMQSAAAMYAVLLMSASHYAVVNPRGAADARIDLLVLKARALREINGALATSGASTGKGKGVSDAMLGAVAKMAAYEAIFGDSATFAAHMRGLCMMLKLRGGFSTLGLDGLVERMLLWIDLNAAHITGLERQLHGAFETKVTFAAPDPFHFAGIS
ncbi:hypothetical protein LTR62_006385 [Meristemomyces frigidus]|uniref:Uncharacterized protein n=1 Tax=Meristemomyces frigidus TaxID=1508187 RepID=A0AAN7TDL1_9PEZI|nr:hypothetical protein LTR62_006385 [Meristemomyces frigidus]